MMRLNYLFAICFACLLLSACSQPEPASPVLFERTPTLRPTPTLVPALVTITAPPINTEAVLVQPETSQEPFESGGVAQVEQRPSPTPDPSQPTPAPQQRLLQARDAQFYGDTETIIQLLEPAQQELSFTQAEQDEVWTLLGQAYLAEGRYDEASSLFTFILGDVAEYVRDPRWYFWAGEAHRLSGSWPERAIANYQKYLIRQPEMGAYVYPLIASLQTGEEAILSYEAALNAPAHRLTLVSIQRQRADWYRQQGNYAEAKAAYQGIFEVAQTATTQGEMTYLMGAMDLLMGDTASAYQQFQTGIRQYPRVYESYLGLIELVGANQPVDQYQRGLVNYWARSYEPCTVALTNYISDNVATGYDSTAHLYLGWCYEGLGNVGLALTQLGFYAQSNPAEGLIEQAKLYARLGDGPQAIAAYSAYVQQFPDGVDAPFAAWWRSALTERAGDWQTAVLHYTFLANNYSWHEDAPEALFRAGVLAYEYGDGATVTLTQTVTLSNSTQITRTIPISYTQLWQQARNSYPNSLYGDAATLWLVRDGALTADVDRRNGTYYAVRAYDIVNNNAPYQSSDPFALPTEDNLGQAEAEAWLRSWLGLAEGIAVGALSPAIVDDPRWQMGTTLWQLGLKEEAKRELESLRAQYDGDVWLSYQLALAFREIGLYRSSILAASAVLRGTGTTAFTAPSFIGRLAYPTYYGERVVELAQLYGYDPRLQLALLRQESLFESFARSGAAAQGLSQVIPDTGYYVANLLAWPNYENEDLYKPYVGLQFGGYYLQQQIGYFNGDIHAALAAYNAGPGNSARWHEVAGADHDLFVETINFRETRLYLERIYIGFVIYDYLY